MKRKLRKVFLLMGAGAMFLTGCGSSTSAQLNSILNDEYKDTYKMNIDEEDLASEATIFASVDGAVSSVLTPEASGKKVEENQKMIIDYSNTSDGYVMAQYKKDTTKKIKCQIEGPTGITYTFNLTPTVYATLPLSEGDGDYKITVYENISGTSYATVGSVTTSVKLTDAMAPFLTPNQYVNYTDKTKCVEKAAILCKGMDDELEKVNAVYAWTLEHFRYSFFKAATVQSGYVPDLDEVYDAGKGICFDYASTMLAMLRSQNIPTKLVIGYSGSNY
ncbi:MAG: transglutaminase-like domain-containing protein, partial [Lachnospiraceae bacterium]|nr:transglutaminase-like domain-containing protein [Lachnospiraceae bacterium]